MARPRSPDAAAHVAFLFGALFVGVLTMVGVPIWATVLLAVPTALLHNFAVNWFNDRRRPKNTITIRNLDGTVANFSDAAASFDDDIARWTAAVNPAPDA